MFNFIRMSLRKTLFLLIAVAFMAPGTVIVAGSLPAFANSSEPSSADEKKKDAAEKKAAAAEKAAEKKAAAAEKAAEKKAAAAEKAAEKKKIAEKKKDDTHKIVAKTIAKKILSLRPVVKAATRNVAVRKVVFKTVQDVALKKADAKRKIVNVQIKRVAPKLASRVASLRPVVKTPILQKNASPVRTPVTALNATTQTPEIVTTTTTTSSTKRFTMAGAPKNNGTTVPRRVIAKAPRVSIAGKS